MKKVLRGLVYASAFMPLFAFAALGNVRDIFEGIKGIINLMTPVIAGLALLVFFWGLVKFLFSAGDPEKRSEGRGIMIWGVVAIFVMVSIFGIVKFLGTAIGIDTEETTGTIPTLE